MIHYTLFKFSGIKNRKQKNLHGWQENGKKKKGVITNDNVSRIEENEQDGRRTA